MDTGAIHALQLLAGACWLGPLVLFLPCVLRIWRGRGDALDWMGSPIMFIAVDQVAFVVRWLLFPHAVAVMLPGELAFWAGCYALSALSAVSLILAWRIARRWRGGNGN